MEYTYFSAKQAVVDKALKNYFNESQNFESSVKKAMEYSLFLGGKRFRPALLLMAYEAFKPDFEVALPSACAVEYIHTYSLIHDDLPSIDNDDLRRGKPTCHKEHGDAVALLAGDALFSEAFNIIAKKQKTKSDILVKVIEALSRASGAAGMVGGQVVDVELTGKKDVSFEQLFYIHSHKTGKLIVAAAKIGAMLAAADEKQVKAIECYARNLGMAFQITDDILDEIGDTLLMGKETGSDKKHKKITYPSVFGIEEAKEKAMASSKKAIDCLKGIEKKENLTNLAGFVVNRSK